ncbi:MAG: galactose mutarotase [Gemmatimonadetes bacterium]|nr:galactose mutarotase [Gemmatimonadota bacterium]
MPSATMAPFGTLPDGRPVQLVTLTNARGMTVRAMERGATIVGIHAPDRHGHLADIVLGFDDLAGYLGDTAYLGAVVGRVANRLGHARFTLDGVTHLVTANRAPHALHGGTCGFDQRLWRAEAVVDGAGAHARFHYVSADGEEGYPGTLDVHATYTLTDANELHVAFRATTDRATPVNLAQHAYFNLSGVADATSAPDILGHVLTLDADRYTPVGAGLIPTGEIASVAVTPFDFRTPVPIGARIDAAHPQLALAGGYDQNFVITRTGPGLAHAAHVHEPRSGRTIDVLTTEPGVQFYAGNFLDGSARGKRGIAYGRRSGFCLETQRFPDAPNRPEFPDIVLRPGATYHATTVFRFGVAP